MPAWLSLLVGAYLLGGIPFAYLLVRVVAGIDVRSQGSGNAGATNAARAVPPKWRVPFFLLIFALDAGKGYAATALLPELFRLGAHAPTAAGLAAVVGHTFSPYLGFRGGKGVATTLGVFAALEPVATLAALFIFFAVYAITRTVALGSLAMAVALPVATWIHGTASKSVLGLTVVLGILIVVRHGSNIQRMLHGEQT